MAELILIGGEVMTRQAAMQQLQAEGVPRGAIDWSVFSVKPLSGKELHRFARTGLVLTLRLQIVAQKG